MDAGAFCKNKFSDPAALKDFFGICPHFGNPSSWVPAGTFLILNGRKLRKKIQEEAAAKEEAGKPWQTLEC